MKLILLLAAADDFNPSELGLIPQGGCDDGLLFLSQSNVVPDGFREALPAEVEQSSMYKARKKSLNAIRDVNISDGADVPGLGVFDTDMTAQLRQTGALLLATLPILRQLYGVVYKQCEAAGDTEAMAALNNARHEFQVPWVLKDNTTTTLGFDELKVIGPAVAAAVAAQVLDARGKKDAALQSLVSGSAFAAVADVSDSDDSSDVPDDSTPAAPASSTDATEGDTADTAETVE